MKRNIFLFFFLIIINHCSFDNKTGIWEDADKSKKIIKIENKNSKLVEVFVKKNKSFNEEKNVSSKSIVEIDQIFENTTNKNNYYDPPNNIANVQYWNKKNILIKSSKLSKSKEKSQFIFYNNGILSHDQKGRIYLYSLSNKKKVLEFNFYKKKFKKYKKKIYLKIHKNQIIAADNLGYLYSLDIVTGKLIWAINYGIPFRSNLEIIDNQLILANQDNIIYSVDVKTGKSIWQFATSQSKLKNNFLNTIVIDKINSSIIFFNTSGELYSINYKNQKINWVLNFKASSQDSFSDLFNSSPLVTHSNNILISTNNSLYNYNNINGSKNWESPIALDIKPVITKNNIFLVSKTNYLICLSVANGDVIWSKNIGNAIKDLKNKKNKRIGQIKNITLADYNILLFTSGGYLLNFDYKNGKIKSSEKIMKSGISSDPLFLNGYFYIFDNKNRLIKYE
jgi:outer membrane protein assembly factor BamB